MLLCFEHVHVLSYLHLFKHSFWGFGLFGQRELIKKKSYSISVLLLFTALEVQLQRTSWGKTSSIINGSCIILKLQCFDTSVHVKDHLGNVIMQIIGFRRKCLSWTLSYKKTNIGKCSFITTTPRLQGALRAPSQHGGEHQGQGWRVSGTAPSTGFCALIVSAEGYLGAEKMPRLPCFAVSGLDTAWQQVAGT